VPLSQSLDQSVFVFFWLHIFLNSICITFFLLDIFTCAMNMCLGLTVPSSSAPQQLLHCIFVTSAAGFNYVKSGSGMYDKIVRRRWRFVFASAGKLVGGYPMIQRGLSIAMLLICGTLDSTICCLSRS